MKTEAIVVGAGVAGTMTALALLRRGISTTLIDRWEPGHSRASSTDYNRVIRAIHGRDEFYTLWAREARERWLELQAETGQRLYYECGVLILATNGHCHWEDATAETFEKLGVPFYRFSKEEVAARFPQFDVSDISYALYEPEAGMIMAHRSIITTIDLFKREGGIVKRGRVTTDSDEAPYLDGKLLEGEAIVMATGPGWERCFPGPLSRLPTSWGLMYCIPLRRMAAKILIRRICLVGLITGRAHLACHQSRVLV